MSNAIANPDISLVFIELGLAVIGLSALARLSSRFGISAIPLYLLAGLAFGNGGLLPLRFSQEFVHIGAEVGVVLLLFLLGVEYTGEKLVNTLRTGYAMGIADALLNFSPGMLAGIVLGMSPLASVLLGGVTYISSSGIVAKILTELKRMGNAETPLIVSILVIEDLVMAVFLPIVGVLLAGEGAIASAVSVAIALLAVAVVLFVALYLSKRVTRYVAHQSDEVMLLSTLGLVLLVSGLAQRLQVSAAIGAFLIGVAISGHIAVRAERLMSPLRDLFAANFFLFVGLQIDPATLPPVLGIASALAAVSAVSKVITGWWAAKRVGLNEQERLRAGITLVPRGEFSIVIAGLGSGMDARLMPLSAAYVLILALAGPVFAYSLGRNDEPTAPTEVHAK